MTIHERQFYINIGPIKMRKGVGPALETGTEVFIRGGSEINYLPDSRGALRPTVVEQVARVDNPNQITIGAVTTLLFSRTPLTAGIRIKTLTKEQINSTSGQAYTEGKLVWKKSE